MFFLCLANKGDMTQVEAALILLYKPQGEHFVLPADGQNIESMFLFVSNAATLTVTRISASIRSHGQTHLNIRLQEPHPRRTEAPVVGRAVPACSGSSCMQTLSLPVS